MAWKAIAANVRPGFKLFLAIVVGLVLTIPLFSVWLLVYDRQTQSERGDGARSPQGWGGPQAMSGPVLVIPYRATATETVVAERAERHPHQRGDARADAGAGSGRALDRSPARGAQALDLRSGGLRRSASPGKARFALPPDLARTGVDPAQMDLSRAELRFGLSDPRGLGANPRVSAGGRTLRLQPGGGSSGGRGFFAWVDASEPRRPSRSRSTSPTTSAAMRR